MLLIIIFFTLVTIIAPYIGKYISFVYRDTLGNTHSNRNKLIRFLLQDDFKEQTWFNYIKSLICFNFIGFIFLFLLLLFQSSLSFGNNYEDINFDLAFNIAASYITNTNWQSFHPEQSISNFTQTIGLTVQNFLAPATSLSVSMALIRGLIRENTIYIGNFYQDIINAVIYIFLPFAIISSIILISQGVPQNFQENIHTNSLDELKQIIPQGPIASQVSISLIGNNGGSFFNSGFSHPYLNPTPFANIFELFIIMLLPASLIFGYARLVGNNKHGWSIYIVSLMILLISIYFMYKFEKQFIPWQGFEAKIVNMEGKELKNKLIESILWSSISTMTSTGALNSDLSSYSPLAIMVAFINMSLSGIIFGSVGMGLCNIIVYILLSIFIGGLMIGKTPEFLGKKLDVKSIYIIMFIILLLPVLSLTLSNITIQIFKEEAFPNKGPHYLTEIIYNFVSVITNNGSSIKGMNYNIEFFNIIFGICMLIGRFIPIILMLSLSGIMLKKKRVSNPTLALPIQGVGFGVLVILTIIIVGGVTFFPLICVGPILEFLMLNNNNLF